MERRISLVFLLTLAGGLLLLGSGCGLKIYYTDQPAPAPYPFPNAQAIEARCQDQSNRITANVDNGNLGEYMGQGLMENVAVVRNASVRYRQPYGMQRDLTGDQTLFLNNMLNDNSAAIDDALQRHQQWNAWYYGNSHPGNYDSAANRTIYISYYNSRLNDQDYTINQQVQSGQLSDEDAQALHAKVQASRQMAWGYYQKNGGMSLKKWQIQKLNKNLEKNNRVIAERTHTRRGTGGWLSPRRPWQSNQQAQAQPVQQVQQPVQQPAQWPVQRQAQLTPQQPVRQQVQQPAQPPAQQPQRVFRTGDNGRGNSGTNPPVRPFAPPTATPVPAPKPAPANPVVTGRPGFPVVSRGPNPAKPGPPKPAPKMVSAKPISDRVNGQANRVASLFKSMKISAPTAVALGKKINTLKGMIKNPNQPVTQDQYNQMAKMADDIDKGMPK